MISSSSRLDSEHSKEHPMQLTPSAHPATTTPSSNSKPHSASSFQTSTAPGSSKPTAALPKGAHGSRRPAAHQVTKNHSAPSSGSSRHSRSTTSSPPSAITSGSSARTTSQSDGAMAQVYCRSDSPNGATLSISSISSTKDNQTVSESQAMLQTASCICWICCSRTSWGIRA